MSLDPKIEEYYTENLRKIEEQYDKQDPSKVIEFWAPAVNDVSHNKAIDLGAGMGHYAEKLAIIFKEVVAVEPVNAMNDRGRVKFPDPNIKWIDAIVPDLNEELHEQKGSFDFACMLGVWHYLSPSIRAITAVAVAEMVKPGGRFINVFPSPPSRDHQFEVLDRVAFGTLSNAKIDEENVWEVQRFRRLPYPIKGNKHAESNESQLLAYDMLRL